MDATLANLSANLRRLRSALGISQEALASKAGLSRAGYKNLEMGLSDPRSRTLQAVATALKVTLADLLRPAARPVGVRFRSQRRLNCREQVIAQAAVWLENYRELESVLDDETPFVFADLARSGRAEAGGGSPGEVAVEVRKRLGLGEAEPIRNICGLLESSGVKVLPISVATEGFFGLSISREGGGPAVVVNTWGRISVERWIFTAAHELGHLLLHPGAFDAADGAERAAEEKEADRFAAELLLPEAGFRKEWASAAGLSFVDRVLTVKRMYRVSYKTILFRLADSSPMQRKVWGRFQAEFKSRSGGTLRNHAEPEGLDPVAFGPATVRAADEPDRLLPVDFTEDRFRLLVRRAVERDEITLSRAAEMLGLRLAQMRALASSWVD